MTDNSYSSPDLTDPQDIADDLLYRSGQSMLQNNFEEFAGCFLIPQLIETAEGKRLIETIDEFFGLFQSVRNSYETKNLGNLVRTVISAEFLEDGVIGSTHVAVQLDHEGSSICTPYPVYSILKQGKDGKWRIESSIYAFVDDLEMNMIMHRRGASAPS